jgi:glycerol uptake facilitator-like aquaporin
MSSSISTIIFSELLGTSVLVFLGNGVITNLNLNSSKAKASD